MNRFETKTIEIDARDRKASITAFVCGDLAFHLGVGEDDDGWTMTHVPTGLAMATQIPDPKAARALVRRCLASDIDWSNSDPTAYYDLIRARPTLQKAIARYRYD